MSASRYFSSKTALSLALLSFMVNSAAFSAPETDKSSSGTPAAKVLVKGDSAPAKSVNPELEQSKTRSKTNPESKESPVTQNPEGTAENAAENADESKAETAAEGTAAENAGLKAQANADEGPSEEELHDQGIQHWNIAKRYMKDWDLDLAQTELDLAVMNWPDLKVAHRDLCFVSLMKLNLWRSVAEFMMTVGLGEAVPLSEEESSNLIEDGMIKHYKKGLVFAREQNWKKAASELELSARLGPDDFAVHRSLAFAYANLGNFARAEEHYKKTFELSPQDGSSRADLAYFLAENGKISEAQKELEEAVKTQPKAAAYHVDLSFMAETRGDFDTASKELKEAVALSPKHADLWLHLGSVLEKKGDKTEAVDAYKQAIAINPKLDSAKEAISKLRAPI